MLFRLAVEVVGGQSSGVESNPSISGEEPEFDASSYGGAGRRCNAEMHTGRRSLNQPADRSGLDPVAP